MWDSGKWYSVASVFFGIIALISSVIFFIGFPAAVLAIFFGIMAVRRYYRKSGTTSIVMGIASIVITIFVFVNVVSALNVSNLVQGNWILEGREHIEFKDNNIYSWYKDLNNEDGNYSMGNYELSTGVYKGKKDYVMGYMITFNQSVINEDGQNNKENISYKYLIYQDKEEDIIKNANESSVENEIYQIMNMKTGQVNKIEKQKESVWWWIF